MEESRLKPMIKGYDEKLFNHIYQKTKNLKSKLAYGIDHRRFGVDKKEILSWFDVKLIFAFNRYYENSSSEELLGYVIKSLQLFKCRILRSAYTTKYSQSILSFEELQSTGSTFEFSSTTTNEIKSESQNPYYEKLIDFIKPKLSTDAFYLFEFELNPPIYILNRMYELEIQNIKKIPEALIIEYFELESSSYLTSLKMEIKSALKEAKEYFNKS